VGSIEDCSGIQHGWLLSKGAFTAINYPGAGQTAAFGISDSGQIVGIYWSSPTGYHGWLSSGGTLSSIDYPGASYTRAQGINSAGDIVGYYSDSSGKIHGFLLSNNQFTTLDFPGATYTDAYGINDEGQIVGSYIDGQSKTHAYVASYTQGPSSCTILTLDQQTTCKIYGLPIIVLLGLVALIAVLVLLPGRRRRLSRYKPTN
jgi:probable HAF family extracellular repeat protein